MDRVFFPAAKPLRNVIINILLILHTSILVQNKKNDHSEV